MNNAQLSGLRQMAIDAHDTRENDDVRTAVMGYMYHGGEDHWRLSDEQWIGCYLLADGFGQVDRDFATSQAYDWSHVRDSSPAAISRIWDTICHWHNTGQLKTS